MTKGEDRTLRALIIPFLAIHAKGGERKSSKQKDRTTTNFKNFVFSKNIFNWYPIVFKKGEKVVFQNVISKPSWTLRGGFHLGGVLFSQRKSIWNRGREFQILKMLLKILFICPWLFAKELWKGFTKEFAKTKHVMQAWSKMLKMKETIHAYLVSVYIGSIPSNLCTYIMQTSSIMHFHICFGLCWHQSPKRGRLKGN
jgi:hypothetical protein